MRTGSIRNSNRGLSRRDFVRVGALTAFGLGAYHTASAEEHADSATGTANSKRCILIWLDGGPTHLDTFDLKPNAPAEVRGEYQPISTNVTGIQICELLPQLAQRMDRVSIVRSVTSPLGEHNFGTHYLMTGYKPTPVLEYPAIGSVVSHLRGGSGALPNHIAVPRFRVGGSQFTGTGFLPESTRPFSVGGDPAKPDFQVRDLDPYPQIDAGRLDRRKDFLDQLDQFSRLAESNAGGESPYEKAYRLIQSAEAKEAFDLRAESAATRQRYGGKTIGQSCLLARRLVERGVSFVTVNNPGWDTHTDANTRLKDGYTGARTPVGLIPSLDLAMSALLDDLQDRGLLDETLVVVMGEFGRTPKINTSGGRDHWPRVFSAVFAGGGVPGGQVIGSSDRTGEGPADHPVTPSDLAATTYRLLGIDPKHELHTQDGRPIALSRDGNVIRELVG